MEAFAVSPTSLPCHPPTRSSCTLQVPRATLRMTVARPRTAHLPSPSPSSSPSHTSPSSTTESPAFPSAPPASVHLSPVSTTNLPTSPTPVAPVQAAPEAPIVLLHGVQQYLEALQANQHSLVVLKVFAPWCRSCRGLQPKVARLAREFPNVRFFKMDYEQNKDLCYRLGVSAMPTFIFYYGASGEIDKFSCGPLRGDIIREKIEQVLEGECLYDPKPEDV